MKRSPSSAPSKSNDSSCSIAEHDRLKASRAEWLKLLSLGYWTAGGTTYEQRQCPGCGSTLNKAGDVVVFRYHDDPPPAAPIAQVLHMPVPQLGADARGAA